MSRPGGAVLVTGAANGIGRATAEALIKGDRIVVGADCDIPALEIAQAELGSQFIPHAVDLADADAVIALVNSISSMTPRLSGIVHSAALFPQAPFADITLDQWDRVMAVNLRAAFLLSRAALTALDGGGSLVFLTSGSGLLEAAKDPFQRLFALYGTSKAALERFARGITQELGERGIVITTITPGAFVHTPGTASIDISAAADLPTVSASHVGKAVAWLASAPRRELAGKRLNACDYGRSWGRLR